MLQISYIYHVLTIFSLQAVDLCESNDLTEDLCRSLGSLGSLKHRQGEHAGALGCMGRALEVAKRLSPSDKLAHTCDLLSAQAEVSAPATNSLHLIFPAFYFVYG